MKVFECTDYKEILKKRLKEIQQSGQPSCTLRWIAERLSIQYTYVSKALNDSKTHLSEDAIYAFSNELDLTPEETEYLILLRAFAKSNNQIRRQALRKSIDTLRSAQRVQADVHEFQLQSLAKEMNYLFDPFCVVVHSCLNLKEFQETPKKLVALLGILPNRLKNILTKLEDLDMVELTQDGASVKTVKKNNVHFGKNHPLMRAHQHHFRSLTEAQLLKLEESEKSVFMATFTASSKALAQVQAEFQHFLKKVVELSRKSKSERVYQLNFDCFPWI